MHELGQVLRMGGNVEAEVVMVLPWVPAPAGREGWRWEIHCLRHDGEPFVAVLASPGGETEGLDELGDGAGAYSPTLEGALRALADLVGPLGRGGPAAQLAGALRPHTEAVARLLRELGLLPPGAGGRG